MDSTRVFAWLKTGLCDVLGFSIMDVRANEIICLFAFHDWLFVELALIAKISNITILD